MTVKEHLLDIIGTDKNLFATFIKGHFVKRNHSALRDAVVELSSDENSSIWDILYRWSSETFTGVARDDILQTLQFDSEQKTFVSTVIEFAHFCLKTYSEDCSDDYCEGLVKTSVLVHEILPSLEEELKTIACRLCEFWLLGNCDVRELFEANTLPEILKTSLSLKAKKKDVSLVWQMRNSYLNLDLQEPTMKKLMLSCASSSLYLACEEGVKFNALILGLPDFMMAMHKGIKQQLPHCTKRQSAAYGDVYFKAWKESQADVRKSLEENCIQDLMYFAVHIDPTTGFLSSNLHIFLHQIHRQKHHFAVDRMIFQLYDPFLWRSLKVPNGWVRKNACKILCDVFPLCDIDLDNAQKEEIYTQQYDLLIALLTDPCHFVRCTAIKGVADILFNYWSMIPSDVIKNIFTNLLSKLICDASCTEVRVQSIKMLHTLVDCLLAVPFMKKILPESSGCFDDINVSVRCTYIRLLLKVKTSKILNFWDIVPVEHLLHQLEVDKPAVCRLLSQLLLTSFLPTNLSNEVADRELLRRCISLIKENRHASRYFYKYAGEKVALPVIVRLMLIIWQSIRRYVSIRMEQTAPELSLISESSHGLSDLEKDAELESLSSTTLNKENKVPSEMHNTTLKRMRSDSASSEDPLSDGFPLDDPDIVCGLLDTLVILYASISAKLNRSENKKYMDALHSRLSKHMHIVCLFFKDHYEIFRTVLYLSSFLPKNKVLTQVSYCTAQLRKYQLSENCDEEYTTYVNALCNWNRVDDVLDLVGDWIQGTFDSIAKSTDLEDCDNPGQKVRFTESHRAQPLLALKIIRHILTHPLNHISALLRNRHLLRDLLPTLAGVKGIISERLTAGEHLSELCSDEFLQQCWREYLCLAAVLYERSKESSASGDQSEENSNDASDALLCCRTFEGALCWISSLVAATEEKGSTEQSFVRSLLLVFLEMSFNAIAVGSVTPDFVTNVCCFCRNAINEETHPDLWLPSLTIAAEAFEYFLAYGTADSFVKPTDLATTCFSALASVVPLIGMDTTHMKEYLSAVTGLLKLFMNDASSFNCLLDYIIVTAIEDVAGLTCKEGDKSCDGLCLQSLKPSTQVLIKSAIVRVNMAACFMKRLGNLIISMQDISSLCHGLHLLKILTADLSKTKISSGSMKEAISAIDLRLTRIEIPLTWDSDSGDFNPTVRAHTEQCKAVLQDLKSSLGIS